jgi:hypothetical protein
MNPLSSLSLRDTARASREDDHAPRASSTFSRNDARHTETHRETQAPRSPSEEDSEKPAPRPGDAPQTRGAPLAPQEKETRPEDFAAFLHQARPLLREETSDGETTSASVTVEALSSLPAAPEDLADLVSSYSAAALYQGETEASDTNSAQTHAAGDESTATKALEHGATQTSQTKEARADSPSAVDEASETPGSSTKAAPASDTASKSAHAAPSPQKPVLSLDAPLAQNPHAAPETANETAPPALPSAQTEGVKLDATFSDEADKPAAKVPDESGPNTAPAFSWSAREAPSLRAPEAPQAPSAMARPERPEPQETLQGRLQNERAELVLGEGSERVSITIEASAARVRVDLVAGTAEAAAAMRHTAHELQTALSQRGLSLSGFQASSQDKESQQSQARDEEEKTPQPSSASSPKNPAPLARRGLRAIA